MKAEDREARYIRVKLDGATAERLEALSDMCHADPEAVAASLLHDVLEDDAEAEYLLEAPAASPSVN